MGREWHLKNLLELAEERYRKYSYESVTYVDLSEEFVLIELWSLGSGFRYLVGDVWAVTLREFNDLNWMEVNDNQSTYDRH